MSSIDAVLTRDQRLLEEAFVKIARSVDAFERYERPHAARVAALADGLATHFHLAAQDRFSLRLAALAHDFGEMTMNREYVARAGPLVADERLDLSRHPILSEQEAAQSGADRGTQLLVRWHHEWWDGSGYPDALRGEQIPLSARILRLADAHAALTAARPFRPAYDDAAARRMIAERAGFEFDPRVVRAFFSLRDAAADE